MQPIPISTMHRCVCMHGMYGRYIPVAACTRLIFKKLSSILGTDIKNFDFNDLHFVFCQLTITFFAHYQVDFSASLTHEFVGWYSAIWTHYSYNGFMNHNPTFFLSVSHRSDVVTHTFWGKVCSVSKWRERFVFLLLWMLTLCISEGPPVKLLYGPVLTFTISYTIPSPTRTAQLLPLDHLEVSTS